MSKYKAGDKIILTVTGMTEMGGYPFYVLNDNNFILFKQSIEEHAEPLSTYTEPLEVKIRRQAAEITRLLRENKELKDKLDNRCDMCIERHEKEVEQARAEGAETAWELARKIALGGKDCYSCEDLKKIFDYGYSQAVMRHYTYPEAAAKVVEWEKAKDEIKVGDVLEDMASSKIKCVVTNIYPSNMAYLVFSDGSAGIHELENMKKTGRHIDIDSFLKQIGEE